MKNKLAIVWISVFILGAIGITSFTWFVDMSNPTVPDTADWSLTVDGFVENPLIITLDELIAMPQTTVFADLYCVDAPDFLLAEGNWTGVKLGDILRKAVVSTKAVKVGFIAKDTYSTDITVETAM